MIRVPINVRLPPDLVERLDNDPAGRTEIVERAVRQYYGIVDNAQQQMEQFVKSALAAHEDKFHSSEVAECPDQRLVQVARQVLAEHEAQAHTLSTRQSLLPAEGLTLQTQEPQADQELGHRRHIRIEPEIVNEAVQADEPGPVPAGAVSDTARKGRSYQRGQSPRPMRPMVDVLRALLDFFDAGKEPTVKELAESLTTTANIMAANLSKAGVRSTFRHENNRRLAYYSMDLRAKVSELYEELKNAGSDKGYDKANGLGDS